MNRWYFVTLCLSFNGYVFGLCTTYCSLRFALCILHSEFCSMGSAIKIAHSRLHTAHCTLHIAHRSSLPQPSIQLGICHPCQAYERHWPISGNPVQGCGSRPNLGYPCQGYDPRGVSVDTPMQDLRLPAKFRLPLWLNPAFWEKSKSKTYFFKSLTKNKRALYLC